MRLHLLADKAFMLVIAMAQISMIHRYTYRGGLGTIGFSFSVKSIDDE